MFTIAKKKENKQHPSDGEQQNKLWCSILWNVTQLFLNFERSID